MTGGTVTMSSFQQHVVDVDLHDLEVRHRGAEMRADQAAEMAVEIVRRDVDLVGVGHRRDLQRFEDAVPGHVDDRVIDRLLLEERPEIALAVDRFSEAIGVPRRAPDQRQRRPGRRGRSPATPGRAAPAAAPAACSRRSCS